MYDEIFRPIIAGLFMGWANVIPGISGGTIAVIMGIFERFIDVINDIMEFKISRKDIAFIATLAIGILIGVITGSKLLTWAFQNHPFYTYSFFFGLILFSLWNFRKEVSKFRFFEFVVGFLIVVVPYFFKSGQSHVTSVVGGLGYFFLALAGVIAGAAMALPGISGSLLLMLMGYYEAAIKTVSKLTKIASGGFTISDLLFILTLGIGVLIGIGTISKLLKIWFEKAKLSVLNFILGLIAGSLYPITPAYHGTGNVFGMFLWIAIGGLVVYTLGQFEK
jgi:putative membrane protein